jgi:hypothetical protein
MKISGMKNKKLLNGYWVLVAGYWLLLMTVYPGILFDYYKRETSLSINPEIPGN